MLAIDPNKRPLAKGALAHEYFTDLPEQMRPPISEPKKNDAFFAEAHFVKNAAPQGAYRFPLPEQEAVRFSRR